MPRRLLLEGRMSSRVVRVYRNQGKLTFVPKGSFGDPDWKNNFKQSYEDWRALEKRLKALWKPSEWNFSFRKKGHIACVQYHAGNNFFCLIDIEDFFGSVTLNKLTRSLRRIGLSKSEATKIGLESTVNVGSRRVLPRGFRQSPILANIVFDRSLLGSELRKGRFRNRISVFNDDILLSGDNITSLTFDFERCLDLLIRSGFRPNEVKTQAPARQIQVFNFDLNQAGWRFTSERLLRFAYDVKTKFGQYDLEYMEAMYMLLYQHYIQSVNAEQERLIRNILF